MEKKPLDNKDKYPGPDVLKEVLGDSYPEFQKLTADLAAGEYQIAGEWHYYNDGKSWLFKAERKKKTMFWLSAWPGYFKVGFYFAQRLKSDLFSLGLSDDLVKAMEQTAEMGRLFPVAIEIRHGANLADVMKLVRYKISER